MFKLAHDLPAAWNAPSTDTGTKQRLIHILVQEIVCDLDDTANEAVLLIHWTGGRHTEVRVPRVKTGRYPGDIAPSAVDALRELAGHWPDRDLAMSLNRMRCKTGSGETWTTVRVREMRERLGLAEYDPENAGARMVSLAKAAEQLGICVGSAKSLALKGILPATQAMKGAQWLVPIEALTSEAVRIGVQQVVERRPKNTRTINTIVSSGSQGSDRERHYETHCGDLLKILWHDGLGMSLYAKRLERGRFLWPSPADGYVAISALLQLGYMLDGIDWRNPQLTWRPQSAG